MPPNPILQRALSAAEIEKISRALEQPWREPAGRIAGYKILNEIGRGQRTIVFEAEGITNRTRVALKVFRSDAFAASERVDAARMFWTGALVMDSLARAASALKQRVVVPVEDGPSADGSHIWFAMELVQAPTLRSRLENDLISPDDRDVIAAGLIRAVKFAHERGIAHRNLRPENIFVDEGASVTLADLGIANAPPNLASTGAGAALVPSASVAKKRDLYDLCAALFEVFAGTGVALPSERTVDDFLSALPPPQVDPVTGIDVLDARIRQRVARFCAIGLSLESSERFATIADLARSWSYLSKDRPWRVWSGFVALFSFALSVCVVADWAWFRLPDAATHWLVGTVAAMSHLLAVVVGYNWWEALRKRLSGEAPALRASFSRWMASRPAYLPIALILIPVLPLGSVLATRLVHRLQYYWVDGARDCELVTKDGQDAVFAGEIGPAQQMVCKSGSNVTFRPETWRPISPFPDGGVVVMPPLDAGVPTLSPIDGGHDAGVDAAHIPSVIHHPNPGAHDAGIRDSGLLEQDVTIPVPATKPDAGETCATCELGCTAAAGTSSHDNCIGACRATFTSGCP